MAPQVAGQLAIGKIDCTTEKSICEEHSVRGYPTLKIYRDGDFFDYSGKRDEKAIMEFAQKMNRPAVELVHSRKDIFTRISKDEDGTDGDTKVVFVLFDAELVHQEGSDALEKYLTSQSSIATQVFSQAARKLQDKAHFALIDPSVSSKVLQETFGNEFSGKTIVAKIETDAEVAPVVYAGELNTMDVMDFVKGNNVGLVAELESHNFRTVVNMGKLVVIGVADLKGKNAGDSTQVFKNSILNYAKNGSRRDEYRFAVMDGMKWTNFLKQFDINKKNLPQIFVLDAPNRKYYQNSTYTEVDLLLEAIARNDIQMQVQDSSKQDGPMEKVFDFIAKHIVKAMIVMLVFIVGMIFWLLNDDEDEIRYQEMLQAQREFRTQQLKQKQQQKQQQVKEKEGKED